MSEELRGRLTLQVPSATATRKVSQFRIVILWFGRILLGTGALCLVVGAGFAIETATFILRATHAAATVVRLDEQTDNDGNLNYAPVFAYTASDQRQYTVRSIVATNPPGFEIGESISVLYLPSNPAHARISSFWQLWFVAFILGVIGIAHGLIGGCLAWFTRSRKPAATGGPTIGISA
jgi:Protein of unknown function (DUF3592)